MIDKRYLQKHYVTELKSARQIAEELECSENKVTYWLHKHDIRKRSISESVYVKANPNGNPFELPKPKGHNSWFLFGLGLGLYWGEGNKANKNAIRLGNTDPDLIKKFIEFLLKIYCIDQAKLRFGLQIFSDVDENSALNFWQRKLVVPRNSFYKTVITPSNKKGTYRKKNKHGVLTVYFSNTKLRDSIMSAIEELRIK